VNILNPKFKYVPAAATDIRKTFAKARREMEAKKQADNVRVLPKKAKAS
jgi:hypothetical protein